MCDEAMTAAKKPGIKLQLGFMPRFDTAYAMAKKKIDEGAIGQPVVFHGISRDPNCPNLQFARRSNSSGLIIDMGMHDFDSARWLLGEEVQEVYVRGLRSRPELHPDTKDLLLVEMFMSNNCMATAEVYGNDEYGYEVSAELVCQRGTVVTEHADKALVRAKSHRGYLVASD
jgi:predicted dehydrogenase